MLRKNKTALKAVKHLLSDSHNVYIFLVIFIIIATILQWAFQPEVLWKILSNDGLSIGEKNSQIFKAFLNLFILIDDPTPISILLVSLTQSLTITMMIVVNSVRRAKDFSSTAIAMIGIGCVSCGGSLLSPVLAAIASNVSLFVARTLGNIVLLISLVLSYNLLIKVASKYEKQINR